MEKFGLFDTIKKLSTIKKSAESIIPLLQSVQQVKEKQHETKPQSKPSRPSIAPALAYIKRHEEISKRIDKKR